MWIDDSQVIKGAFKDGSGSVLSAPVPLAAGKHSIVMLYYENQVGPAFAALKWQAPSAGIVSIPSKNLTPEAPTVQFWKDIASARISLDDVPVLAKSPFADIARNVRITAAYAELAQANPKAFVWLGAASIASKNVGKAMDLLTKETLDKLKAGETLFAELLERANTDLANGNQAVYNELYWQHLAFNYGGIALMKQYATLGSVTAAQLAAWQKIADGLAKNDPKLIFQGNADLLRQEQLGILQRLAFGPIHQIITSRLTPALVRTFLLSHINRM